MSSSLPSSPAGTAGTAEGAAAGTAGAPGGEQPFLASLRAALSSSSSSRGGLGSPPEALLRTSADAEDLLAPAAVVPDEPADLVRGDEPTEGALAIGAAPTPLEPAAIVLLSAPCLAAPAALPASGVPAGGEAAEPAERVPAGGPVAAHPAGADAAGLDVQAPTSQPHLGNPAGGAAVSPAPTGLEAGPAAEAGEWPAAPLSHKRPVRAAHAAPAPTASGATSPPAAVSAAGEGQGAPASEDAASPGPGVPGPGTAAVGASAAAPPTTTLPSPGAAVDPGKQDEQASVSQVPAAGGRVPQGQRAQAGAAPDQAEPPVGATPGMEARPHAASAPEAAGAPQAGGGSPLTEAARRVLEVVDRLAGDATPRRVLVDLPQLGGLRLEVSLRGEAVHVSVVDRGSQGDLVTFGREVAAGLAGRGFEFTGFGSPGGSGQGAGEWTGDRWQQGSAETRPPRRRGPATPMLHI